MYIAVFVIRSFALNKNRYVDLADKKYYLHVVCCYFCTSMQEIINMNRNGNSAIFVLYVCNCKKIKKLFASTLNGITASVRRVSFIIVVLNAKLA